MHNESNVEFVNFRDRFLAQASGPTDEDLMLSFQRVREGLANVVYIRPQGKPSTLQDLLLEIGVLCVHDLAMLSDRIQAITTVRMNTDAMEGITALENTVDLLRCGLFTVLLQPHQEVTFVAGLAGDVKQTADCVWSQTELCERRNQIAMAEIPVEVAQAVVDDGAEFSDLADIDQFLSKTSPVASASTLIHDAHLRALVIQRFTLVVNYLE